MAGDLSTLFTLQYGNRSLLVPRPVNYRMLQENVRIYFPEIPNDHRVVYFTVEIGPMYGREVEVSTAVWAFPDLLPQIKALVLRSFGPVPLFQPPPFSEDRATGMIRRNGSRHQHTQHRAADADRSSPLMFDSDSSVEIGKPVIYLFVPANSAALDVRVTLSIVPEWSMTTLYPVAPITASALPQMGEEVQWRVLAHPGGSLNDQATGLDVSYLFWEAEAKVSGDHEPEALATSVRHRFIPSQPTVDPFGSVLLPLSNVPHYLDATLKTLGLNVEARTSFITYWLPTIMKHEYIALRFLPQAAYERAAPLEVVPKPDIVIRVFMLFKGIRVRERGLWFEAEKRAKDTDPGSYWANVVMGSDSNPSSMAGNSGGYEALMQNEGLFRVLEWGGAEV